MVIGTLEGGEKKDILYERMSDLTKIPGNLSLGYPFGVNIMDGKLCLADPNG